MLGLALLGCQDPWVPFSSPEGRYAVEFPSQPVRSESHVEKPGPATTHTYTATAQSVAYVVAWTDYPPDALDADAERVFDQGRDGLVTDLHGELVGEKKLQIQGRPARAFTLRIAGAATILEERLILVGARLYQVAVVDPKGRIDAPETRRFFRSFELAEP